MYNASTIFFQQKSLHNLHVMNVCHILEQNIIQYSYNSSNLRAQSMCVQIVIPRMYSYENMPAMDQKFEFILEYTQKFIHFELLHEVQQTDDP